MAHGRHPVMSREARLLSDEQMRGYIRDGYVSLRTSLPREFHDSVYRRMQDAFDKDGNPGNNLLPRVPEVQQVFDDPVVHGALASVLGPTYLLHAHRHPHYNAPGSPGQTMHKDSWARRHHRTRWMMAFYYPQDTPVEIGPTGIVPGSSYYNQPQHGPNNEGEVPVTGEAGSITVVHYDLWHRGMPNRSDRTRFMIKFLFTRLDEPTRPTWDNLTETWAPVDTDEPRMWRHMWRWQRGEASHEAVHGTGNGSIGALASQLGAEPERVAFDAAYRLAELGPEALPSLMDGLRSESGYVRRNAAYGLTAMGSPAVQPLVDALEDARAEVREMAASALLDIGWSAESAVGALCRSAADPAVTVRRVAVEAIGTAGQRVSDGAVALASAMKDEDEWVRRNAALAL
ncbi:phytanoyl-CoA dioxygenase, partial [Candidatus Poribacteria bacterium]|nr:phytanoyl-CoA dioxygenase [Candidatus Poribacteria bacterium]